MSERISELTDKIDKLERQLLDELDKLQKKLNYRLEGKRVRAEDSGRT